MGSLRRVGHLLARRFYKSLDGVALRGRRLQWFLLAGAGSAQERCPPRLAGLAPVYPPADRFWADPFAWSQGSRRFVFVEEYPYATRVGRISVLELGADLQPLGPAVPVIEEPRHLSYPFLFEHLGELFMVPESARTRRVDLYRCTRFPDQWVYDRTLLEGLEAADATLFEHAGRWWLFCAARYGPARINESLLAFHAESPLSRRWVPHRMNPLVRDFSRGRPAGRIFRDGAGRLIRPAQDSVPRYGYGLRLQVIDVLDPDRYAEHGLWHATAKDAGGWWAMHHLDWHDGLLVMDAARLLPRPER